MSVAKRIEKKRFTYGDYLAWPDDERWEIIDGEAYDMTPAPNRFHQKIAGNLFSIIHRFLEGKACEVYIAPFDVRLPDSDEVDEKVCTVVQPDIVVVCDPKKLDERGCRGAPDWVIEILSPSTSGKDHLKKRELYERHGVKEYWLIHPTDRVVMIYRLAKKTFGKPSVYEDESEIQVGIFPDLMVQTSKIFPSQPKLVKESPRKFSSQPK